MALTGRQIRQLRSLAPHLAPVIPVGKQGGAPAVGAPAHAARAARARGACAAGGAGWSSAGVSLSLARPPARAF